MRRSRSIVVLFLPLLTLTACKREERQFRPTPNASQTLNTVQISGLNPGANSVSSPPPASEYEIRSDEPLKRASPSSVP